MLTRAHPRFHPPRRLAVALLAGCAAVLLCLSHPAHGLASAATWTPEPAGLVKTSRPCPSPAIAAYYNATCWTVQQDQSNPLYWPQAPYPWGQCTYWAVEMRPDLWNTQSDADPNSDDWTAYTWASHAALEGLTVDHVPAAGAVLMWPQSDDNTTGHVAYVQSVAADPTTGEAMVTIQEMNDTTFDDPAQGQGDTMTLPMSSSDLAGVQFIHTPGNAAATATSGTGNGGGATNGATTTTATTPSPTSSTTSPTRSSLTPTSLTTPATATTRASRTSSAAHRRPGLTVRVGRHGLQVSTHSPAPLMATVITLPSRAVVSHLRLRSGSGLRLPTGRFRLCVAQAPVSGWQSARACVSAADGSRGHAQVLVRRAQAFSRPATASRLDLSLRP